MGIEASRARARAILARVRAGKPAFEPKGDTFAAVVANWLKRHVEGEGLRSQYEIERLLNKHIRRNRLLEKARNQLRAFKETVRELAASSNQAQLVELVQELKDQMTAL
jgi:uncharacterized sporulation protein YeaH/YhbH (DUF444 family)